MMNPIASPRFGMYHTIGTVTVDHPVDSNNPIGFTPKELGSLHMQMILNSKFPYASPETITPETYIQASPDLLRAMKETAEKYYPLVGKPIQDTLKKIDPDYRKDAFALAVMDKDLPLGIATGKDARFLESNIEQRDRLYNNNSGQAEQALRQQAVNHFKNLPQGKTLDVTLTEDADGQRVVKSVNIR